jgi:PEP-CTERM motif
VEVDALTVLTTCVARVGALVRAARGGLLAVLLLAATPAAATTIHYALVDLGAGSYRAIYSVINDGSLGAPLEGFDIFFDPSLYLESSLGIVTPLPLAADWDQLILGSGVLVSAAYDALGLSGGIPDGGSASGFAVEFSWIAPGIPGPQPFEIFDPGTFEVLESGVTTPVPEPDTFALVLLGLALLARKLPSTKRH